MLRSPRSYTPLGLTPAVRVFTDHVPELLQLTTYEQSFMSFACSQKTVSSNIFSLQRTASSRIPG